ncbi:MAG: flotillin family protein [Deltaproteobacteria bacterium]|nr:MAG: flotillin family protein [Deltaproteobacteria bacterium]
MIEFLVGAGALGVAGIALLAAGTYIAGNLLYICEPNEILVFSGSGARGYTTVKGGRRIRIPLLQKVDRLDLTNMIIEVSVSQAYSKGGIPLTVQGVANLKIASHDQKLDNAIERLLGKPREEVIRIAKDVLEGNLRGVLAKLTPEQVNEDKLLFAEQLLEEAEHDLSKLGLVLDTMKIQNVFDERGYLDSIGRRQSAEIIKKSRIAEAQNKAQAMVRDATNRESARLAEIESEEQIARAQAERRIADARTNAKARVAEEVGRVNALIARAEAALEAEEARVEQVRRQLEADVIEPARASMEAGISEARGRSARILEEGRATVGVLQEMIRVWKEAGPNARDIFLMQKLHVLMESMVDTIGDVQVDRLTMLPSGGDSTAVKTVQLVEELKAAIGVDLPKMLTDVTSGNARITSSDS